MISGAELIEVEFVSVEKDFEITPENEKSKAPQEIDAAAREVAKQLRLKDIDVTRICDSINDYTLLHCAARGLPSTRQECNTVVLALCYAGATVSIRSIKDGMDPLLLAVTHGHANTVRTLLQQSTSFDVYSAKRNVLHYAVHHGNRSVVQVVCQEALRILGESEFYNFINAQDSSGQTPLHAACARGTIHANDLQKTQDCCAIIATLFEYCTDVASITDSPKMLLPTQVGRESGPEVWTIDCPGAEYGMRLWEAYEYGEAGQRATLE